jgi:hypothetical protein
LQKPKWTTWIELAAAASVLIGLIFVALEIRQSNEHARAESIRDLFQVWDNIYQFEYENEILVLIRKTIEEPNEVTDHDFLRLSKYLDLVMNAQLAQAVMQQTAGLVVGNVVTEAPGFAKAYLSSRASRVWFEDNAEWIRGFSPDFYSALASEIERNPVATELPHLERFLTTQ